MNPAFGGSVVDVDQAGERRLVSTLSITLRSREYWSNSWRVREMFTLEVWNNFSWSQSTDSFKKGLNLVLVFKKWSFWYAERRPLSHLQSSETFYRWRRNYGAKWCINERLISSRIDNCEVLKTPDFKIRRSKIHISPTTHMKLNTYRKKFKQQ